MHRYEELEKLYYKKKYFKIFIFFILLGLVGIGFYFFKKSSSIHKTVKKEINETKIVKNNKNNIKEVNKTKKVEKKPKEKKKEEKPKVIVKKVVVKEVVKENKKTEPLKFILPQINELEKNNTKKEVKKVENKQKEIEDKPKEVVDNKEILKPRPKIIERKADINTLIKEFRGNKNYSLAITIAKLYLKKNNLKSAREWALKANSLNTTDPESWILFADILIKEGRVKKAKELLRVYLDSYGNNDIIEEKLRSINGK